MRQDEYRGLLGRDQAMTLDDAAHEGVSLGKPSKQLQSSSRDVSSPKCIRACSAVMSAPHACEHAQPGAVQVALKIAQLGGWVGGRVGRPVSGWLGGWVGTRVILSPNGVTCAPGVPCGGMLPINLRRGGPGPPPPALMGVRDRRGKLG